jgi:hypothetical protein
MVFASLLMAALFQPNLSDTDLLELAEESFRLGVEYRKDGSADPRRPLLMAVKCWTELQQRGVDNPAIYRNIGHAYVLADDLGHAILTFHCGLRQYPRDDGLRDSLAAARELVVYKAEDPLGRPVPERHLPWLRPDAVPWLLLAAFVCYAAACVGVTRWLMTRRGWLLTVAACSLLVAALPTALATWLLIDTERLQHAETERTLVVFKDEGVKLREDEGVKLRKGDGLRYPPRYETTLHPGVEARLVRQRGDWVQIELAGGEIGWVPKQHLLIDGPDAD